MEMNRTSGSVWKNILSFSLPYLLSYFLQTLYGMADLFIIGQYEGVASTTAQGQAITINAITLFLSPDNPQVNPATIKMVGV